jgi:CO/xanthine dehydrogenase Mo-binding subunit
MRAVSGWSSERRATRGCESWRALGIACSAHISGLLSTGAIVRLLEDGTILLNTGSVDIGQGSNTILSQICAEALRVPLDRVSIASPDTDGSPYNWGTTASRITYMTGTSVIGAAAEVERKIKDQAAEILECAAEDLELVSDGLVAVKGIPQRNVSFAAVSGRAHWAAGGPIIGSHSWVFNQKTVDPKRATVVGLPFPQIGAFVFNATAVDVEVDETTGKCKVQRAWSACDVGRAINPQMVEGQIEGAFVQGLGFALFEEMVWNGAQLINPTLMDYKIPTFMEAPSELKAIIVESHDPRGPYGAKSVGEIGINSVAAAIANAVNAALGVRLRRLPLTPPRVLEAILENETKAGAVRS